MPIFIILFKGLPRRPNLFQSAFKIEINPEQTIRREMSGALMSGFLNTGLHPKAREWTSFILLVPDPSLVPSTQ